MLDILPSIPQLTPPALAAAVAVIWYRIGRLEAHQKSHHQELSEHLRRLNTAVLLMAGSTPEDVRAILHEKGK